MKKELLMGTALVSTLGAASVAEAVTATMSGNHQTGIEFDSPTSGTDTNAQINDKNFKEKINGGVVVAVFTSEWQEQDLDEKILKGVEGYQDCEIIYVASEQAKKVVKKLRFRNFPSIALFFDGSKKETWKADMDGEVDCSSKEIRNAIDDMLAEDVF